MPFGAILRYAAIMPPGGRCALGRDYSCERRDTPGRRRPACFASMLRYRPALEHRRWSISAEIARGRASGSARWLPPTLVLILMAFSIFTLPQPHSLVSQITSPRPNARCMPASEAYCRDLRSALLHELASILPRRRCLIRADAAAPCYFLAPNTDTGPPLSAGAISADCRGQLVKMSAM